MNTVSVNLEGLKTSQLRPQLASIRNIALGMLVVGVVLTAIGFVLPGGAASFFPSYLVAYLFWLGVTTGSLGLWMVHNTSGGGWGFIIRRPMEAATRLLPLMAVLYIPILLGLHRLYPWARPEEVAKSKALQYQQWWMNQPFFLTRVIVLFASWMLIAYFLNKWSAQQDESDDPLILHKMNMLSAPCIVWFVLSVTVLAVDWVMTLTKDWVSSIIGFLFVVGQGLSTFALMQILVTRLGGGSSILDRVPRRYYRDLGNLTLAFILLWAYMSYSQFLITYSGNTAEESVWYVQRELAGWPIIGFGLIAFHFAFPFLVLISSSVKVRIQNMAKLGFYLIVVRFLDLTYWVQPTFRDHLAITPMDIGLFLAMGGVWLALWTWQMEDRDLLPSHDPRLERFWPEVEEQMEESAHGESTPALALQGGE